MTTKGPLLFDISVPSCHQISNCFQSPRIAEFSGSMPLNEVVIMSESYSPTRKLARNLVDSHKKEVPSISINIVSKYTGQLQEVEATRNTIDIFPLNKDRQHISSTEISNSLLRKRKLDSNVDEKRNEEADSRSPERVQQSVIMLVEKWGKVLPIPPEQFLRKMLVSRGLEPKRISSIERRKNMVIPSEKQIKDYDNELVWAIRNSDLKNLRRLFEIGKSMSACNKFSESIVHMACRRSDFEVVKFLLDHGGSIAIIDDYGRTPLHDACWRSEPRFDIVTLLLDMNLDLIHFYDSRGSGALDYVREEHWVSWCAYLFYQREKYWKKPEHKVTEPITASSKVIIAS